MTYFFVRPSLVAAGLLSLAAAAASAESIAAFTDHVGSASATQIGYLQASYNPQDWAGDESYPGTDPTTLGHSYHYKTYTFAASDFAGAPYVEITFNDLSHGYNLYASAYSGSYDPKNPGANWLGDEGYPGNYAFVTANQFEVVLPTGSPLVLVANTIDAGNSNHGVDDPYKFTVDAYADANYTEPIPTPEPSSFALLGSGLLGVAETVRRRRYIRG